MSTSERRVELLVTWVLLGFAVWYGIRMAMYSNNAGRVPAVVAGIMAFALVVQLVFQYTRKAGAKEVHEPSLAQSLAEELPGGLGDGVQDAVEEVIEEEADSHDTLFRLSRDRASKLIAITLFSVLFYVGALAVGFTITSGVLMFAILLYSRERLWVAIAWALSLAFGTYWFVVGLLGMDPWQGWFIG